MPGKALPIALFSTYLLLLTWVVLWKLEIPWIGRDADRTIKLIPFVAGGGSGASAPFEVAANLALFVPFGVYLGLIARSWAWWRSAAVIGATSLAFEVAQYVLAVGSSDITDVIVNTTGGIVGIGLLALVRRTSRSPALVIRICSVGTVLALLAGAAVHFSPLRYGPPGAGPGGFDDLRRENSRTLEP